MIKPSAILYTADVPPVHDHGDVAAGEHVDCHDGKHLPAGGGDTERMVQTGNCIVWQNLEIKFFYYNGYLQIPVGKFLIWFPLGTHNDGNLIMSIFTYKIIFYFTIFFITIMNYHFQFDFAKTMTNLNMFMGNIPSVNIRVNWKDLSPQVKCYS